MPPMSLPTLPPLIPTSAKPAAACGGASRKGFFPPATRLPEEGSRNRIYGLDFFSTTTYRGPWGLRVYMLWITNNSCCAEGIYDNRSEGACGE
jgi:hypothetical protein